MSSALGLLAVLALILATAYFVLAEFSFVAVKRGRLEDRAAENKRALKATEVHKQLNFMLSGAQLGITVTSLVIGFIAEDTFAAVLRPALDVFGLDDEAVKAIALIVGLVLATLLTMVLGELAPKNFALAKPEASAILVAPSMLWLLRLGKPIITFFDRMANGIVRRLGQEPVEGHQSGISVEELDLIVEESAERGELTGRQANLLSRAIEFATLRASAAMIPWNRVSTVSAEMSGEELRRVMSDAHSRYPVVDDQGGVIGTVHVKDLLHVDDADDATISVGGLARTVLVVPELAGLKSVLDAQRTETTEMAIVVDEYGAPAGIVTLEDLVEELVGEIGDEYDEDDDVSSFRPISESIWRFPGMMRVDEVERATGIELPDGEGYETVAGLVLDRLQRIPDIGDRVEINDVELMVTSMDKWTIDELELAPKGASTFTIDEER